MDLKGISFSIMLLHIWEFFHTFAYYFNKIMYIVYGHENLLNSKIYIGITKFSNPNKRWLNGKGYRKTSIFYKAIEKYGWEGFSHIILNENLSKEEAMTIERTLIKKYKDLGLSYNIGEGGEGTNSFSPETIIKLQQYKGTRASMFGIKHTEEAKIKIRENSIGRKCSQLTKLKIGTANKGINNGMYKKIIPEEVRKKVSIRFSKPVLQFTLNREFLQEFPSATLAQKTLNIKINHIGSCCKNIRKTCGGYIWKYKEN